MNESIVEKALQIRGVRGAAALAGSDQVNHAKLGSKEAEQMVAALLKATADVASTGLGSARNLVVRTRQNENIVLYLTGNGGLAVICDATLPVDSLGREVRELMGGN
jgi:hypothetical protein